MNFKGRYVQFVGVLFSGLSDVLYKILQKYWWGIEPTYADNNEDIDDDGREYDYGDDDDDYDDGDDDDGDDGCGGGDGGDDTPPNGDHLNQNL